MAEDKQEEKFDFTLEGEAQGFVTLDQARFVAMQTARERPGNYGTTWQSVPMVFEVVDAEETEDDYSLILSFSPEGEFTGTPGRKSLLGGVARRLSAQGFLHVRRRKEVLLSVYPTVTLLVVAACAALVVSCSLQPTDAPLPTQRPAAEATAATTAVSVATPTPVPIPTVSIRRLSEAEDRIIAGNDFAMQGRFEEAIAEYDQAISLDPQLAMAYGNRGAAYNDLGQHERAIQDHNEAIRLDPQNALTYDNRGVSYGKLGQFGRAVQDWDEAIRLDPTFAMAFNNRGIAYDNLDQVARAVEDYDEAIRLNPQLALAYLNRASAYIDLNKPEQARADLDIACRLDKGYCLSDNPASFLP